MGIIDLRAEEWIFPAANTPDTWHEINAEAYDEMLCCMPPIYRPCGFMICEAARHLADGTAMRSYFVEITRKEGLPGSRYFVRDTRDTPHSHIAALTELRAELKKEAA